MSDEPIQVRLVRWMGVGVGAIVAVLGVLVCLLAWSFGVGAAANGSLGEWLGTAVTLLVGVLAVRYGLSLVRRARTDDEIETVAPSTGWLRRSVRWRRPPTR